MGLEAHLVDEKCIGTATTFYGTVALSFVIPPAPACRGTEAKRRRGICGSLDQQPMSDGKSLLYNVITG
jgi:hypothetical protein